MRWSGRGSASFEGYICRRNVTSIPYRKESPPIPDPDRVEFVVVVDDALSPGGLVKFGLPLGILETLRLFVRAPMPATVDHMTRYLWLTLQPLQHCRYFGVRAIQIGCDLNGAHYNSAYKDGLRLDSIHRFGD